VEPGQAVALSASADDPDGATTIGYEWTQSCTSVAASFTDRFAASTTWSSAEPVACTLTVTATSNGLSASRQITVLVQTSATGTVAVAGSWKERIVIAGVAVSGLSIQPGITTWFVRPGSPPPSCGSMERCELRTDASIPYLYFPGQYQSFTVILSPDQRGASDFALTMEDDCGGSQAPQQVISSLEWLAPPTPAVCLITFRVTSDGMTDEFTLGAVVEGCPDDLRETGSLRGALPHADSPATAWDWGTLEMPIPQGWPAYAWRSDGLLANDEDWFAFTVQGAARFAVVAESTETLPVQLYASDGKTLLVEGGGAVVWTGGAGEKFYAKVGPSPAAASCGSKPYSLDIHETP
jgi:hypothetical protein